MAHDTHVTLDISDVSPRFDITCLACRKHDEELDAPCDAPFDIHAWNHHLRQIGEHIDAMDRHTKRTTGLQRDALHSSLMRLRARVADCKIKESK